MRGVLLKMFGPFQGPDLGDWSGDRVGRTGDRDERSVGVKTIASAGLDCGRADRSELFR